MYLIFLAIYRCDYNKYTLRVLLDKAEHQKDQSVGVETGKTNDDSDDDMLLIRQDENEKIEFSDENEEDSDDDSEENDAL